MQSPQVIEMLHELQQEELKRVSHRHYGARAQNHGGTRRVVARALVRLGMAIDSGAARPSACE